LSLFKEHSIRVILFISFIFYVLFTIFTRTLSWNFYASSFINLLLFGVLFLLTIVRKKRLSKIDELKITDPLTMLYNRRKFEMDAEELIASNTPFAIIFGDLSNFKIFNDTLGKDIGDVFLTAFADRLKSLLNEYSEAYRYGGDEFVVIYKSKSKRELEKVITKFKEVMCRPLNKLDLEYKISMKIAVSRYPKDSRRLSELIRYVLNIIHNTEMHGMISHKFVDEVAKRDIQKKDKIAKFLRDKSMESFQVYLQPIVDVKSNKVYGFECLTRVQDENLEFFQTEDLITIIERQGKITNLDIHVFDTVCDYHQIMKSEFNDDTNLSFNISALSLNEEFYSHVQDKVKNCDIDKNNITIEITESININGLENSLYYINKLSQLGFKIAIDDFGVGYSSLSYISKLPLSVIKIDKMFMKSFNTNHVDKRLVELVSSLSNNLNVKIVAEGVENNEQLDFVKSTNVDLYQGYLYGKATPFRDALRLLEN